MKIQGVLEIIVIPNGRSENIGMESQNAALYRCKAPVGVVPRSGQRLRNENTSIADFEVFDGRKVIPVDGKAR